MNVSRRFARVSVRRVFAPSWKRVGKGVNRRTPQGPILQRGNISLMMLGMAFVFIACAVLALDTGRLYLERQRLQTQADMAALELEGRLRFDSDLDPDPDPQLVALEAAANNGFSGGLENISLGSCGHNAHLVRLTRRVPDSLIANLT